MPSITSWVRLEPRCRSEQLEDGLAARVYDPLWCLARQWQLGELRGDDAGSPIVVRIEGETASIQPSAVPLEVWLESEPRDAVAMRANAPASHWDRAESGRQFLRLLATNGMQNYRDEFASWFRFPDTEAVDDEARAFLRLVSGRIPDGAALKNALAPGGTPRVPNDLAIKDSERATLTKVISDWLEWHAGLFSEPSSSAWDPHRLEYSYQARAELSDRDVRLDVPEYVGDGLDWYSFSMSSSVSASRPARRFAQTLIPTPATYPGMPARRFWEFEDAAVDFGALDAAPGDVSRLVFVEFALLYGGDWFVAPVELEIATVTRIDKVVVTDTFGERTTIPSYRTHPATGRWRMYTLGSDVELLVLPPSPPTVLESSPLEDVRFMRDETANLVWGVERVFEGPEGQRRERRVSVERTAAVSSAIPRYRLGRRPPEPWVPLRPIIGEQGIILRPAIWADATSGERLGAQGEILHTQSIADEEVPVEGLQVTRVYRYARWHDGTAYLWTAHRKRPGAEEPMSGMQFDFVEMS